MDGRILHVYERWVAAGYFAQYDFYGFADFVQRIIPVPSIMIGPFEKA
jgi:hypothetical protein